MLVLGIILVLLAVVCFGYLWFGTQSLPATDVDLGVFLVSLTPLQLYLLGAATLVILVVGLALLAAGTRASARRRREVKTLRKQVHDRPDRSRVGTTEVTDRPDRRAHPPERDRDRDSTLDLPPRDTGPDRPRP